MDPNVPRLWSYIPLLLFLVALAVSLTMAYRVWLETHEEEEPATEKDRLSEFERAYYAGEMDEQEFRRVRELLDRSCGTPSITEGRKRLGSPRPDPSPLEEDRAAPQ